MKKIKEIKIIKILKIQLVLTCAFVLAYLGFGFVAGKNLLFSDIQSKGKVAGTMITVMVKEIIPPNVPVVSSVSGFTPENNPYIKLEWGLDENATAFDVYRDGVELMLGLTDNEYVDNNVIIGTSYSYYVVARGIKENATSDSITVSVNGGNPIESPFVEVVAFAGKNIENFSSLPYTTKRRPLISGTTNIADAIIELRIQDSQTIFATTAANTNGSWQWISPINLSKGKHTLYIKAIDPSDSSVKAAYTFIFRIKDDGDNEEKEDEKESEAVSLPSEFSGGSSGSEFQNITKEETPKIIEMPVDFDLSLAVNSRGEVYRGENLKAKIIFSSIENERKKINLSYFLINSNQEIVGEYSEIVFITDNKTIVKSIPIPDKLDLGRYKLQVNASMGNLLASHEGYFSIEDRPILKIGASTFITYRNILDNLGWCVIFCLIILLFFGSLSGIEYYLFMHSSGDINEKILKKKGFID